MPIENSYFEKNHKTKAINVGYALNQKKLRKSELSLKKSSTDHLENGMWLGGGLADIIYGSTEDGHPIDGVKFVPFDTKDVSTLPSFHLIIHKLTEDLEQEETSEKIKGLKLYLQLHPETIVIDPLESVRLVTSRSKSCEIISRIESEFIIDNIKYSISQPKYFVVNESQLKREYFLQCMDNVGLKFPIICKPVTACGSADAHLMAVLVKIEDISLLSLPVVIQQYHNHGGVLFKVYVLGEDVMVFRRSSLPDLKEEPNYLSQFYHSVLFDSRQPYPSLNEFTNSSTASSSAPIPSDLMNNLPLPMACFREAARRLRSEFELSLFGFDVILNVKNDDHSFCPLTNNSMSDMIIIDVNYFPSYKEVTDFPTRLRAHLHAAVEKRESR
jgi:inositol-1,3,4-trisphosphate 5/6-kinase/inositol-tetrakisphosphate 1-kinase